MGALFAVLVIAALPSATHAATPRGWEQLLAVPADGVFPVGWASGRAWFLLERSDDEQVLYSARVAGGRLASLVANPMGKGDQGIADALLSGSTLVGVSQGTSRALTLLPSGKVSGWAPMPGDPVVIARGSLVPAGYAGDWTAKAAVTVGGRTVWALPGRLCPPDSDPHHCTINGGGYSSFAVCCTSDGQAVDLTSLLRNTVKGGTSQPGLGVDAHGRLWLTWVDNVPNEAGIDFVQLDATTLQPGHVQFLGTLPGVVPGRIPPFLAPALFLGCGDACSVVVGSAFGVFRWPGAGPAAALWRSDPLKGTGGQLLAAGPYGGGLALASYGRKNSAAADLTLGLVRTDAEGRNPHTAASVTAVLEIPRDPSHVASLEGVTAMVTPAGLVAFALYRSDDARPDLVLATVLHG